jgi:hypothetical protein
MPALIVHGALLPSWIADGDVMEQSIVPYLTNEPEHALGQLLGDGQADFAKLLFGLAGDRPLENSVDPIQGGRLARELLLGLLALGNVVDQGKHDRLAPVIDDFRRPERVPDLPGLGDELERGLPERAIGAQLSDHAKPLIRVYPDSKLDSRSADGLLPGVSLYLEPFHIDVDQAPAFDVRNGHWGWVGMERLREPDFALSECLLCQLARGGVSKQAGDLALIRVADTESVYVPPTAHGLGVVLKPYRLTGESDLAVSVEPETLYVRYQFPYGPAEDVVDAGLFLKDAVCLDVTPVNRPLLFVEDHLQNAEALVDAFKKSLVALLSLPQVFLAIGNFDARSEHPCHIPLEITQGAEAEIEPGLFRIPLAQESERGVLEECGVSGKTFSIIGSMVSLASGQTSRRHSPRAGCLSPSSSM